METLGTFLLIGLLGLGGLAIAVVAVMIDAKAMKNVK